MLLESIERAGKGNRKNLEEHLKNKKKTKKNTIGTELKLFFHKEVKAQKKMQDLRLLIFLAARGREGICCQRGFKAKSSRHCCIHLWESRKCDLYRSKLAKERDLKWEAMNDSPDSGPSPMENRLSRDLGSRCSFSPSPPTVLPIL